MSGDPQMWVSRVAAGRPCRAQEDSFHSDDDIHQLGIVVVNVLDQFGLCIGWSRNENRTGVGN